MAPISKLVECRVSNQKVGDLGLDWRTGDAPGSIPELLMRRCVLGKDTLCIFPIETKQSARSGGSAWRQTCNQKRMVHKRTISKIQYEVVEAPHEQYIRVTPHSESIEHTLPWEVVVSGIVLVVLSDVVVVGGAVVVVSVKARMIISKWSSKVFELKKYPKKSWL